VFVSENWERWSHEKPKFFSTKFIASIPFSVLSEEIREEILNDDEHGLGRNSVIESGRREEAGTGTGRKWKNAIKMIIRSNLAASSERVGDDDEVKKWKWYLNDL
jgi:hypothetical protein